MNKKMVLSALGLVALSSSIATAAFNGPGDGVVGSVHDMNLYTGATKDTQGRVCAFCHTPHHALTSESANDYLPLWSHLLPTTSYTPYDSATIDATINAATMMEGPSKLCMSCHDGAIAVDTHYSTIDDGQLRLTSDGFGGPAVAYTSSLSNDHPIGFIFDADDGGVAAGPATGDPDLAPADSGQDKWIRDKSATYIDNAVIKIEDRLFPGSAGKPIMTCATCHDVHNKKNVDAEGSTNYLLLSPNTESKICLTCHIK